MTHTRASERRVGRELSIQKVYGMMQAGVGITEAAVMVNKLHSAKKQDSDPVSWTAVKNFVNKNAKGVLHMHKRTQKKSGIEDKGTKWAKARLAQAQQVKQLLATGEAAAPDAAAELPPLYLDGISCWVDFRLKVRLKSSRSPWCSAGSSSTRELWWRTWRCGTGGA